MGGRRQQRDDERQRNAGVETGARPFPLPVVTAHHDDDDDLIATAARHRHEFSVSTTHNIAATHHSISSHYSLGASRSVLLSFSSLIGG